MIHIVNAAVNDVLDRVINIKSSDRIGNICDSLDVIELIMYFEDQLGILISYDRIKDWYTFGDIVDYLAAHSRRKAA
jgi:acyl carrier protein